MTDPAPLWTPDAARVEQANLTAYRRWLAEGDERTFADYGELWEWSVGELGAFWDSVWRYYDVAPHASYTSALGSAEMPGARWFEGAELNYAEELLRRASALGAGVVHRREDGSTTELSVADLRARAGALAATLQSLGIGPGDRVAGYLPNVPEAIVGLLATASLGAVWCVCAPDFAIPSVVDRFAQVEPRVLVAIDGYRFGGRDHDRHAAIAELRDALPTVRATIVVRYLAPDRGLPPDTIDFGEAVAAPAPLSFQRLPFEAPLWILFSSGTTGLPKGIVQSHGGILLEHLKSLGLCLDLRPADRYLFFSSTSWMAWNYLIGGLLHGCAVVLYDGSPAHGGADGLWRVAADTGATVLGMGSAYAAACQKAGAHLGEHDLGALRLVVPTGSPLPPSGWRWLLAELGPSVRIDSICGGTDVCTAFFGGSELLPVWLGEASCRWLGIDAHAFDPGGGEVIDAVGEFVLTSPMPSMPTELWGDPDGSRYRASYFEQYPGTWRQGDWITVTDRGSVRIWGRSDATLNRGGVRLGSAEIYGAVEALDDVADSLVVGVEQDDGSYWMPLFVVSRATDDAALHDAIVAAIRAALSPRHLPDEIVRVDAIPRTLTGKKLEVPVKRILQGVSVDDAAATGSIDRPDALEFFARYGRERRAGSTA